MHDVGFGNAVEVVVEVGVEVWVQAVVEAVDGVCV